MLVGQMKTALLEIMGMSEFFFAFCLRFLLEQIPTSRVLYTFLAVLDERLVMILNVNFYI